MPKSVLCLTPGDPLGIGPEVTVKFLHHHLKAYPDCDIHVIGSMAALAQQAALLHMDLPTAGIDYHNITGDLPGEIAYRSLETAVAMICARQADALVTGPIAKSHLHQAGLEAHGHTEILEQLAHRYFPEGVSKAEMLFVYRRFRMLLLTRHVPLAQVSQALLSQNIHQPLATLCDFLIGQMGIARPRVAMLGVNPHAGEIGGVEESLVLKPAIDHFNATTPVLFEGPFPADGFFRGFHPEHCAYDAVVAAYHDQGLIPFKLIAGHQAVNVTLGLPFIRTSVGHGTAFDIAGQGLASEEGLIEAVSTARMLLQAKLHAVSSLRRV